jgi:putative restriction endonuclease
LTVARHLTAHVDTCSAAMTKAVLTTKVAPTYDDLPEFRYHFPRTYLRQIQAAVGDWIVYYEPRRSTGELSSRGGRQAYFATARIDRIDPDPARDDHFYAYVSGYQDFDHWVPFALDEHYFESALRKDDGSTNKGAFGRAVRNLSDHEYDLILAAGFVGTLGEDHREQPSPTAMDEPQIVTPGFAAAGPPFTIDPPSAQPRRLLQQLVTRPFRERAFTSAVKSAYGDTCAVTGFKIINGGGRSEVQAAHIMPVAADGPDSIRNGIALSGTIHWMFDRGLISVSDDYRLLIARERVPEAALKILPSSRELKLPRRPELLPHPFFLDFHRRNVFKG